MYATTAPADRDSDGVQIDAVEPSFKNREIVAYATAVPVAAVKATVYLFPEATTGNSAIEPSKTECDCMMAALPAVVNVLQKVLPAGLPMPVEASSYVDVAEAMLTLISVVEAPVNAFTWKSQ